MVAVGAIAVAASEATGERAWLFAAWTAAILLEVVLLIASSSRWADRVLASANVEHLAERFGLLVVIVLGESVLTIVATMNGSWNLASGLSAAVSLAIIGLMAWTFFLYSAESLAAGFESLRERGDVRGIRDTFALLPFLLVAGVAAISGAIAAGIHHPDERMPLASAVSSGGGIALFYLTNAVIALRFGRRPRAVAIWAGTALLLSAGVLAVALTQEVGTALVSAMVALGLIVGLTEVNTRRAARV